MLRVVVGDQKGHHTLLLGLGQGGGQAQLAVPPHGGDRRRRSAWEAEGETVNHRGKGGGLGRRRGGGWLREMIG